MQRVPLQWCAALRAMVARGPAGSSNVKPTVGGRRSTGRVRRTPRYQIAGPSIAAHLMILLGLGMSTVFSTRVCSWSVQKALCLTAAALSSRVLAGQLSQRAASQAGAARRNGGTRCKGMPFSDSWVRWPLSPLSLFYVCTTPWHGSVHSEWRPQLTTVIQA